MKIRVLPPVPPKPPKRGILKGPRTSIGSKDSQNRPVNNSPNTSLDTTAEILIKNTLQNELITYENLSNVHTDNNNLFTEEVRRDNSIIEIMMIGVGFFCSPFIRLNRELCE